MICTYCDAPEIDVKPLYYVGLGIPKDTGYYICLKCGKIMGEWCNR